MYKLSVKIEGIERRKRSTGLLHIVAGLFLVSNGSSFYKNFGYQNFAPLIPIFIVGLISLIYGLFRKKLDARATYNHWIRLAQFLTFCGLGFMYTAHNADWKYIFLFLWAITILFLMFTERKIFHDTDIQLKKEGVYIPGYFTSHQIPWHVIEDFVIRQDYVTIFRKNQKFVQLEMLEKIDAEEISKMNSFCKEQIVQHAQVTQ